jgi:hypothetical protein
MYYRILTILSSSLLLVGCQQAVHQPASVGAGSATTEAQPAVPATVATPVAPRTQAVQTTAPVIIPTFACLGIYWKPEGGATDNPCAVHYRVVGADTWHEAMPLWFDATDHPQMAEHSREYRGSIVGLQSGTAYEIRLALATGGVETICTATTWSEQFTIARTVIVPPDSPLPLVISEGGSAADGYVLYTCAAGTVLDAKGEAEANIVVNASHVILRGFTLTNAVRHGVQLGDVQDVVVEQCDISGWGRSAADCAFGLNLDSALYSRSERLERIVVQACNLHHPRSNSNSWTELRPHDGKQTKHPIGPQGISFEKGRGRYVIRNNHIWSDADHKFNDGMGELRNFSYGGFPNRDSDIYGNEIANAYDDGAEIEGADMNVRVWGNSFDDVYGSVGAATSSLGPLYIFRNVMHSSRKGPKADDDSNKGAYLVKIGNEDPNWGHGSIFVFHNTMLQPAPRAGFSGSSGGNSGIIFTSPTKKQCNITSRNNILQVRDAGHPSVRDTSKDPSNDYDYDLINGSVSGREGIEAHAVKGVPLFDTATPGLYPLLPGSPGYDAGVRLPNFNDGYAGAAPDMGAYEAR